MANYKMVLSYDGSRYKGWQKLGAGELTVQAVVECALKEVLGVAVEVHGSGRTDAGVHAVGQVFSVKISSKLPEDFCTVLNQKLPEDIRMLSAVKVSGSFHARYSAVEKSYRYVVDCREKPDVFSRKYACHYPQQLDVEAMRRAADFLVGTHDFSSFTDDKAEEKDKVRTIYDIQIAEQKDKLNFTYIGNGFLQHMVRILTGTLLEVGSGKRSPEEIPEILKAKERAKAGFMVPAKGLFLDKVSYE